MAFPGGLSTVGLYPAPATSTQILREDLLDAVINLDKQKKAAVFLAAAKTVANGLAHEWLIDSLPSTSTAGAVEGNDWASAAVGARTRLSNIVQTFRRDFAVSLDQVEYSLKGRAPGVSNEYEHTVENYLLATEQSIDARIVAAGTSVAALSASAAGVSALAGGLRNWQVSATGTVGVATAAAATNAVMIHIGGAWSRTKFLALHEYMFNLGADPDTLAVDSGVKADITNDILGETAAATAGAAPMVRQIHTDASMTEYTADIQYIRTDFGRVAVLVDRFIPQAVSATNSLAGGAFFLYERSKVRVAFWRPLRHYPLPPTGDSMKGYVHAGATFEVLHPNSVGIGYNITT